MTGIRPIESMQGIGKEPAMEITPLSDHTGARQPQAPPNTPYGPILARAHGSLGRHAASSAYNVFRYSIRLSRSSDVSSRPITPGGRFA